MMLALVLSLSPWGHASPTASAPRQGVPPRLELGSPSPSETSSVPEDEDEVAEAGRAFSEGVQAYKDGRYADALDRFSRAQALAPHPDTLFNLGLAQQRVGEHVAAWRSFEALLEQAKDEQEREDILLAQAASRPHVAWVSVRSEPAGLVCFDGRPMPINGEGRHALLTTPGEHRLDVGRQRRTIALEGGESRTVELVMGPPVAPPPPRQRLRALAGLSLAGTGAAVGLGLGTAFVDDSRVRLGLAGGVAAAGTLAITSTVVALVVHRRARRRKPPPPLRECPR